MAHGEYLTLASFDDNREFEMGDKLARVPRGTVWLALTAFQ